MILQRLKRRVKHFITGATPPVSVSAAKQEPIAPPRHQRFLSEQPRRTAAFLQAAKEYVGKLPETNYAYLYEKPFDRLTGPPSDPAQLHALFYQELYQVMNLLKAMEVPFGGRVLEVGSGPGWVTEILLGLGYAVDGIEPCEDMIRLASERVQSFFEHHRMEKRPQVTFHCCTLEECRLPDAAFDAVFFHAALHHVIDEEQGFAQCARMLKTGGVLGISEACWQPGNRRLEAVLEEEMARFGTLENPFTIEYLDYLLQKHGFANAERYHSVNGLFPAATGDLTIKRAAQHPAQDSNLVTARRWSGPTTADADAETRARIEILEAALDEASAKLRIKVRLVNCGSTAWLSRVGAPGQIGLGLRGNDNRKRVLREADPRHWIPSFVLPGNELVMTASYELPPHADGSWWLDLVSENRFWFSEKGTERAFVASHYPQRAAA